MFAEQCQKLNAFVLYQLWKTRYDNAIDRSEMEVEVVTDDLGNDEGFPQTNTRQQRKLKQKIDETL